MIGAYQNGASADNRKWNERPDLNWAESSSAEFRNAGISRLIHFPNPRNLKTRLKRSLRSLSENLALHANFGSNAVSLISFRDQKVRELPRVGGVELGSIVALEDVGVASEWVPV